MLILIGRSEAIIIKRRGSRKLDKFTLGLDALTLKC